MDTINLKNRPKTFTRRTRKGGIAAKRDRLGYAIQTVTRTPEGNLSKHEKSAKSLAGPTPWTYENNPLRDRNDNRDMRSRKARGHILAVAAITGEDPDDVMLRLGLTSEEISHIPPFRKIVTWE